MVTKLEGLGWAGFLFVVASFLQVGDTDLEPIHYCINKEIKSFCYDLSDSKVTCYTQLEKTGGKQCRGGQWEVISVIPDEEIIRQIKYKAPSGGLHHTKDGCMDCD